MVINESRLIAAGRNGHPENVRWEKEIKLGKRITT
jgi:hypothetical protein